MSLRFLSCGESEHFRRVSHRSQWLWETNQCGMQLSDSMYWVIDSLKSPATTIELKTFNWLRMKAKEQKLNVSAFFPQPICEVGLVMRQVILDRCCFEVLNTVSPYPMIYLSTNLCSINQMNANLLWRHVIRKQVRREDVRNFLVDRKIGLAFVMTLSWICDEAFQCAILSVHSELMQ